MTLRHGVFIETHLADDGPKRRIGLTVLCECSALLLEVEGFEPQVSLDAINEARWSHYDQDVECCGSKCTICGDEG